MNSKIIKIILWTAVILWMVLIFMFSAENAEESIETSDGIVDIVVDHVLADKKETMDEEEFLKIKEQISHFIRKSAHFSLYTVLGILVMCTIMQYSKRYSVSFPISSSICILYAATDEIHQIFVPGRAGSIFDVFIDSSGSLSGIMIVFLAVTLFKNISSKKKIPPNGD